MFKNAIFFILFLSGSAEHNLAMSKSPTNCDDTVKEDHSTSESIDSMKKKFLSGKVDETYAMNDNININGKGIRMNIGKNNIHYEPREEKKEKQPPKK